MAHQKKRPHYKGTCREILCSEMRRQTQCGHSGRTKSSYGVSSLASSDCFPFKSALQRIIHRKAAA